MSPDRDKVDVVHNIYSKNIVECCAYVDPARRQAVNTIMQLSCSSLIESPPATHAVGV
jgi:hypothetical protein